MDVVCCTPECRRFVEYEGMLCDYCVHGVPTEWAPENPSSKADGKGSANVNAPGGKQASVKWCEGWCSFWCAARDDTCLEYCALLDLHRGECRCNKACCFGLEREQNEGTPCQSYSRAGFGRRSNRTGKCFGCGSRYHLIASCPFRTTADEVSITGPFESPNEGEVPPLEAYLQSDGPHNVSAAADAREAAFQEELVSSPPQTPPWRNQPKAKAIPKGKK